MSVSTESHSPELPWSIETRTWVSLLLFAHLFAVLVGATAYTQPSVLQERLHNLFEPYLRNLHLTALPTSYPFARFHLTHAGSTDVDYAIEIDAERSDGTTETIELPPSRLQPFIRFRRYQALVNSAGTLASGEMGEGVASILPKAIAGSVLHNHGASGGVIRIQAIGLADLESAGSLADIAQAARENESNVYEAQLIIGPGSVELLRKSTTLEVAPAQIPQPGASVPRQSTPAVPGGVRP